MRRWTNKLKLRLPALVLLAATAGFWSLYDRHEADGGNLLGSRTLADPQRVQGAASEAAGHFALNVPEGGAWADITFRFPAVTNRTHLRVRARVKTDGVVAGEQPWHRARVVLVQYDGEGRAIPADHLLMAGSGSTAWKDYETVFRVQDGAAYAELSLQQAGSSGTAEFEGVEVEPVRLKTSFVWWRIVFALLWVGAGCVYFSRCGLHQRKLRTLIVINALAIIVGTLVPGDWIEDATRGMKEFVTWIAPEPPGPTPMPNPQPPADPATQPSPNTPQIEQFKAAVGDGHRAGHFVLFASLSLLVCLSIALEQGRARILRGVALDILLFAAITESLQFLTLDRSADVRDLLVDAYGMALAFLLFLAVLPLVRRLAVRPK